VEIFFWAVAAEIRQTQSSNRATIRLDIFGLAVYRNEGFASHKKAQKAQSEAI
jgi:hypothetical protein